MARNREELYNKMIELSEQVFDLKGIIQNPIETVTEQEIYEWDTQANNVINELVSAKKDILDMLQKK